MTNWQAPPNRSIRRTLVVPCSAALARLLTVGRRWRDGFLLLHGRVLLVPAPSFHPFTHATR